MKNFIRLFLLVALLFTIKLNAQKKLGFEFDYAKFNFDTSSVYLEIYYELDPQGMQLKQTENGFLYEAIVHIEIKNVVDGKYFLNKDWKIPNVITDTSNTSVNKSLVGVLGFTIPKGTYTLDVKAHDFFNESLSTQISEKLIVEPFPKNTYSISDIQLASNIRKEGANKTSLFYKNTLEVVPNPSMVFSNTLPVLFYYSELYNLSLKDSLADFKLNKDVYNSLGKVVYKSSKTIKQSNSAVVEIGLVNLSKLPTDTYSFVLSLVDTTTNKAYLSSKRFFLYNPAMTDSLMNKQSGLNYLSSEFGVFSQEECDNMFKEVKYIASQGEIDQYDKLDSLNAKRQFLYNFWKNRDPEPATQINEFKLDYMKRVNYANEHFSNRFKKGYLSDRGRVYLTYGEPDQKDYYPNESNMKPYEIWFYNSIEGGVTFIFGDLTGFSNYELLNSTKRGEVRDDNWQNRLQIYK